MIAAVSVAGAAPRRREVAVLAAPRSSTRCVAIKRARTCSSSRLDSSTHRQLITAAGATTTATTTIRTTATRTATMARATGSTMVDGTTLAITVATTIKIGMVVRRTILIRSSMSSAQSSEDASRLIDAAAATKMKLAPDTTPSISGCPSKLVRLTTSVISKWSDLPCPRSKSSLLRTRTRSRICAQLFSSTT